MAIRFKLAALVTFAVFEGIAPTLSAFDHNFGFQYSQHDVAVRNTDEQLKKER
jgi:hypothetical protein